jgi:hypothetical protein
VAFYLGGIFWSKYNLLLKFALNINLRSTETTRERHKGVTWQLVEYKKLTVLSSRMNPFIGQNIANISSNELNHFERQNIATVLSDWQNNCTVLSKRNTVLSNKASHFGRQYGVFPFVHWIAATFKKQTEGDEKRTTWGGSHLFFHECAAS